jgi:hypothetical protein
VKGEGLMDEGLGRYLKLEIDFLDDEWGGCALCVPCDWGRACPERVDFVREREDECV